MKKGIYWMVFFILNLVGTYPLLGQVEPFKDPKTGKKGLLHSVEGFFVLPCQYHDVQEVYSIDSLWIVRKGALKGLFSETGRPIIPVRYDEIEATFHMGIVLGYCGVRKGQQFGLYRLDGKQLLPAQYTYLRVLDTGLFVAKLPGGTQLRFLDETGKLLFQYEGEKAWPGYDNQTIEVIRADKSRVFITRSGQAIFTEKWKNARWTDGKTVVVGHFDENGKLGAMGLLSMEGDTLLPCQFQGIQAITSDFFNVVQDRKMGMVNARGEWVFPLEQGTVAFLKEEPGNLVLRKGNRHIRDTRLFYPYGQLFAENFLLERPFSTIKTDPQLPFLENYFTLRHQGEESSGLITADGQVVLAPKYSNIRMKSSRHPILATQKGLTYLFDLKGNKIVEEGFAGLDFTSDPTVFLVNRTEMESLGFFYLDTLQASRFGLERIIPIRPLSYFGVKEAGSYYLYNPSGRRISDQPCEFIGSPGPEHYKAWRKAGKKGTLVAYGKRKGADWFAFDSTGKGYIMPPLPVSASEMDPPPPLIDLPVGHDR
jgi:hypothetical protein